MTVKALRGVRVPDARKLLLGLANVVRRPVVWNAIVSSESPVFARFRDDDTVLVLQLATIGEREVLMELDPRAFFFTEHYRTIQAVLIRLAEVPAALLTDVVTESWAHVAALPPARPRKKPAVRRRPS